MITLHLHVIEIPEIMMMIYGLLFNGAVLCRFYFSKTLGSLVIQAVQVQQLG